MDKFDYIHDLIRQCYRTSQCDMPHIHDDSCRSSGLRIRNTKVGNIDTMILEGLIHSFSEWHAIMSMPADNRIIGEHEACERNIARILNPDAAASIAKYQESHKLCNVCCSWVSLSDSSHTCVPLSTSPSATGWFAEGVLCPRCGAVMRAEHNGICSNCQYWSGMYKGGGI